MDDLCVFVVLGIDDPPLKLISAESPRSSVVVPRHVQQVVVFSHGKCGKHFEVTVKLTDANRDTVTTGNLTPSHKCLLLEFGKGGSKDLTLTASLEEDNLIEELKTSNSDITHLNERTPKSTKVPNPTRGPHGKRKRGQDEEVCSLGQENVRPNNTLSERSTPHRRVRGQSCGERVRLLGHLEEQAGVRISENHNPKGKQVRAPVQTGPLVKPSGRWGQTLCPIDAQTAILIGGQGSRMQFCKDPMWKLCTEDMSWVTAETLAEGPTPEGRIGHTATFDPESKRIFVFGGSKNKKWFNDVHILDTQSWRWTMVEAQGKVPPLAYHSCSLYRGELFVLGGVFPRPHPEPDGCNDALYIFNPELAIWYQPIVNGVRPAPRSGHSACVLQGKIYMFGGWDTPVCFNDMHVLDLGLMEFSAVKTAGVSPSPRSWHGCAALSDSKFLIHGGYNGNNALSDTFMFNTDINCWTTIVNTQLSATPRAGHSLITMGSTKDEEQEQTSGSSPEILLVFGGGDNEGSFFSDLTALMIDELVA